MAAAFSNAVNLMTQHSASVSAPKREKGWRLVAYLFRQPLWLLGWIAAVGGFAFQAIALHFGQLSVVQPILVTELVFVLVLWFAMVLAPTLQPWGLIGAGAATVVEAKLSSWESFLALFGFCVLGSASYLAMEIYAGFRPSQSEAFLARFRAWMETRTDQVIIVGSLILGFWLIANSIYLIVT